MSLLGWTIPVEACSPGVVINNTPLVLKSASVWMTNYMVTPDSQVQVCLIYQCVPGPADSANIDRSKRTDYILLQNVGKFNRPSARVCFLLQKDKEALGFSTQMNSQEYCRILYEGSLTLLQKVGVATFRKNMMVLAEH